MNTAQLVLPAFVGRVLLRLAIASAPRTKKTHNRTFDVGRRCGTCNRGQRTIVMPSEQWTEWRDHVVPRITAALPRHWQPIAQPVNCAALFYRDANRGDSHGLYQGLADVLEEAGVVADDRYIKSWDGSRLETDASRPRVELVLTAL